MKLFFLSLFTSVTFFMTAQVNNYQVGDIVNDFTVTDTQGNQYNLYNLTAQGKYVFLDFFYVSCSSCQSKISIFNEFWDKYGCGDYEVFCLAINQGFDNDADVIAFEDTYGGTSHHAPAISSDGGATGVTADFGVNVFSTFCVIAPDNKLLLTEISPVDSVKNLEDALLPDYSFTPMPCTTDIYNLDNFQPEVFLAGKNLFVNFDSSVSFTLSLYDLTGKQIMSEQYVADKLQLRLNNYAQGIYLLKMEYDNHVQTQKILLR